MMPAEMTDDVYQTACDKLADGRSVKEAVAGAFAYHCAKPSPMEVLNMFERVYYSAHGHSL